MISKLPPSVQLLLALIVGFVLGSISSYFITIQMAKAELAENDLEVIILDQKAEKKSTKVTNKILTKIRKENAKDKAFECSDAKLPVDRVQRLQREIKQAGQRSRSSLLLRAIERASDL